MRFRYLDGQGSVCQDEKVRGGETERQLETRVKYVQGRGMATRGGRERECRSNGIRLKIARANVGPVVIYFS